MTQLLAQAPQTQYVPNEIVVANEHAALVAWLIEEEVPAPNDLLGLTRFVLRDPGRSLQALRARLDEAAVSPGQLAEFGAPPVDDLERILQGVRACCAAMYGRWTPTIGKNRMLDHVTRGSGAISHGHPQPVSPAGAISHGSGTPAPTAAGSRVRRWTRPGSGVRVGIVDTRLFPVAYLHDGWVGDYTDTYLGDEVPPYRGGHATFVGGLVLDQAPGALLQLRHVLDDAEASASSWDVAEAIVAIGRSGVDVINLSLVGYSDDGRAPLVLSTAIDRLDPEIVVVAAAGNHGDVRGHEHDPGWPAALDDVVAVGAVDADENRAPFSPDVPWIDVSARGVDVESCFPPTVSGDRGQPVSYPSGFASWSGTSFAAAQVSGAVAAGIDPGRVTARQSLTTLLSTARPAPAGRLGGVAPRVLTMRRLPG
ncbi:S8 family peptidase [Microlunatus ginsengisoli]|uniref:Peptidase S8/S53 domain-containing protein n=1 Tax=Microlunatus ginsengisoli TaxID=363863 RepID=A0ABP6ZZM6_9ACTN